MQLVTLTGSASRAYPSRTQDAEEEGVKGEETQLCLAGRLLAEGVENPILPLLCTDDSRRVADAAVRRLDVLQGGLFALVEALLTEGHQGSGLCPARRVVLLHGNYRLGRTAQPTVQSADKTLEDGSLHFMRPAAHEEGGDSRLTPHTASAS